MMKITNLYCKVETGKYQLREYLVGEVLFLEVMSGMKIG